MQSLDFYASTFWEKGIIISIEFDETEQKNEMLNVVIYSPINYFLTLKNFNYILKEICAHNRKFECRKIYKMKSKKSSVNYQVYSLEATTTNRFLYIFQFI